MQYLNSSEQPLADFFSLLIAFESNGLPMGCTTDKDSLAKLCLNIEKKHIVSRLKWPYHYLMALLRNPQSASFAKVKGKWDDGMFRCTSTKFCHEIDALYNT